MHDNQFETSDDLIHGCRAHKASDFTLPGSQQHYPPSLELEPTHLDITLLVDVDAKTASGIATHTIRAARKGPRTLTLHAVDMEILGVIDGDGGGLSHRYDGKEIRITWDDAFEAGEERTLAVTYRIENPVAGLYFSAPTDEYPDAPRYAATDNETEHARHWLPTIDLPSCRPTVSFHLRSSADFTILANGAETGEDAHDDGTKTVHWELEQPCPSYLTCFVLGDLVRQDDGEFNGIPVAYFTTRQFTPEDLQRSFGRTRDMLQWLSDKLGFAFPYPKYYQFALPGFGGAMENISLVSWDDRFVLDETLAQEWEWLVDQINIHEMAHSYFGDLITCRDFAHAWLKESWATYTETLWLEHARGDDECQYDFYTNVQAYIGEADGSYKRPIVTREFNHSWHMYDRHLYPGGASRLHMLRKELGDETFFEAVRTYVERFAFRVVETDDFRRTLEEISGRSLGQWFDQWIHGKGYPALKAAHRYDEKRGEIEFTVEQTQIDAKQGVKAFSMPLDLGWVIDGELHVKTVDLDAAKHTFVCKVEKKPDQVRIDPRGRTVMKLEFNPGDEMLRKQLTEAPDVIGRILAGKELAKTAKRRNIEAVAQAYGNETFWGVRVRFAEALAECGTQAAVDALADLLCREQDGMVFEHLIRAAGRFRDGGVRAALELRLDEGIDLYRAHAAALEALGLQRENAPVERLVAGTKDGDPYGIVPSGALTGLALSRSKEALETLLANSLPGSTSNRVRPAAARALGVLGRTQKRPHRQRVTERLTDLLRDPVSRVREAASDGMVTLGEPAGIGPLIGYGRSCSAQMSAGVDRKVARIRKAQSAKPGGKEKQFEELTDKVRKLGDRLETLEARVRPEESDDDKPAAEKAAETGAED